MTDPAALQKLLTWMSPAFPVGAFAWSAGLESVIADRTVSDAPALQNWLAGALAHGGLKTDAILLAEAWRMAQAAAPIPNSASRREVLSEVVARSSPQPLADTLPLVGRAGEGVTTLADLADLALALTPARERQQETTITGDSFALALKAWPMELSEPLPSPCPYPIAVGAMASAHGIDLADTLLAFVTTAVHSQISVAVRLVPLGQTDGLKVMAALEPQIAALATTAAKASLAEIGGIAYATDIAQMRHETLEPRIFRS